MIRRYKLGRDVELEKRTVQMALLERDRAGRAARWRARPSTTTRGSSLGGVSALAVTTDLGTDLFCAAEDRDALRAALDFPDGDEAAAEIARVESGRPRYGVDLDDSVIPQEAGLNERAVSFTKGCYVGQETVARLYYRGKPNRRLLGLRLSEPAAARHRAAAGREGRRPGRLLGRLARSRADRARAGPARGEPGRHGLSRRCHGTHRGHTVRASKVRFRATQPGRELPMAAHVIVLANRTAAAPELIEALVHRSERGPIRVTLVMPAAGPGTAARAAAKERLETGARGLARRGDRALRGRRLRPGAAGRARRGLGPDAPRRGRRLHAPGPELQVDPHRSSPRRRALHGRIGDPRGRARPGRAPGDRAAPVHEKPAARAAQRAGLGRQSRRDLKGAALRTSRSSTTSSRRLPQGSSV